MSDGGGLKIEYAKTVNIMNEKTIFVSTRTRDEVIQEYMPADVEEYVWRKVVIENIESHLEKIQLPLTEVSKFYKWLNVKKFKKLQSLNNVDLFKVHEYVTSLQIPWRVEYSQKIIRILERKELSFESFKAFVSIELAIEFNSFDELSDLDLSRVRYLATQI